jgi:peptide alpha-N-acetyltransferase
MLAMNMETQPEIVYRPYAGEMDLPSIIQLVEGELSEPYVIYTYRYFLHQW